MSPARKEPVRTLITDGHVPYVSCYRIRILSLNTQSTVSLLSSKCVQLASPHLSGLLYTTRAHLLMVTWLGEVVASVPSVVTGMARASLVLAPTTVDKGSSLLTVGRRRRLAPHVMCTSASA